MALGPGTPVSAYRCHNHPEREGVGICVRCRQVVCVECTTKIDRMNFCASCLNALSADPEGGNRRRGRAFSGPVAGVLLLVISFALLSGLFVLLGLIIATWRSSVGAGL